MSFYWVRRAAVETCKQDTISRQSGISHCNISANCVEHFCHILRSIWQCSIVRNTQNHKISLYENLLFVIFFQHAPCITGLPLCSSWNGKKMMEVCGISHNSKRNYCSDHTQFFYDPPKPLFQHLFLKHSTRPLIWKLCITFSRKFIYCHVRFPHDSIAKYWSLTA